MSDSSGSSQQSWRPSCSHNANNGRNQRVRRFRKLTRRKEIHSRLQSQQQPSSQNGFRRYQNTQNCDNNTEFDGFNSRNNYQNQWGPNDHYNFKQKKNSQKCCSDSCRCNCHGNNDDFYDESMDFLTTYQEEFTPKFCNKSRNNRNSMKQQQSYFDCLRKCRQQNGWQRRNQNDNGADFEDTEDEPFYDCYQNKNATRGGRTGNGREPKPETGNRNNINKPKQLRLRCEIEDSSDLNFPRRRGRQCCGGCPHGPPQPSCPPPRQPPSWKSGGNRAQSDWYAYANRPYSPHQYVPDRQEPSFKGQKSMNVDDKLVTKVMNTNNPHPHPPRTFYNSVRKF